MRFRYESFRTAEVDRKCQVQTGCWTESFDNDKFTNMYSPILLDLMRLRVFEAMLRALFSEQSDSSDMEDPVSLEEKAPSECPQTPTFLICWPRAQGMTVPSTHLTSLVETCFLSDLQALFASHFK